MNIQENIPLAPLTTFGIGGSARYYAYVETPEEAHEALVFARENNLDVFVLGDGSNIIISDSGFDGLVVHSRIKGIEAREEGDDVYVTAGAGEDWDEFAAYAVEHGWWGVENLSGIPGLVGGAPIQNINAYGQHASDVVHEVHAVEIDTGEAVVLPHEECGFDYRHSSFNSDKQGKYLITEVVFKLSKNGIPNMDYAYVKRLFEGREDTPSIQEMRDAILGWRKERGTLKGLYQNAGSCFKNPTNIGEEEFKSIYTTVVEGRDAIPKNCCPDPWYWKLPEGGYKISAGCLMHFCEFLPGTVKGNIGTNETWTLAIINRGGATATEVMEFVKEIRQKVYATFGIELAMEPELVGFTQEELDNFLSL